MSEANIKKQAASAKKTSVAGPQTKQSSNLFIEEDTRDGVESVPSSGSTKD